MADKMTDILLLIGHGSRDEAAIAEYQQFADTLALALGLSVKACFLEFADPPIVEGLRACVDQGAKHIVALPLFLGAARHQKNDVPAIINWARQAWSDVQIQYGTPIGVHYALSEVLAERAEAAIAKPAPDSSISLTQTALLVVGRGSRDPDSNADVARVARLLWEGRGYGWVTGVYYSLTQPSLELGIEQAITLGLKRLVILPYLLFTGYICRGIHKKVNNLQAAYPDIDFRVAEHLNTHPKIIDVVAQRYQEALTGTAAMTCDICKYRHQMVGFEDEYGLPQFSDHHHGLRGVPPDHGYTKKIQEFLPPQYQDPKAVNSAPMGATDLVYQETGEVAWDVMWTDFCDLALAGGPPHRGDLLEPVLPEMILDDLANYERVLAELERGFRLVTTLPVVKSDSLGWIGLACTSEDMALWLLRAIVVENITVRREGNTLYLPAGPHFQLEREIKNVITAVAKTYHYWTEHNSDK